MLGHVAVRFSGFLVISMQVTALCARLVQNKGLIWDARQQARAFTELSAIQDKPAMLQTQCLYVPVFACLLCHEMERGCAIVAVEQCKYAPFFSGGRMHFGVLLGGIGRSECCRTRGAFHALAKLTWMNSSISITYVFFSLYL